MASHVGRITEDEITAQPEVLERLFALERENVQRIARAARAYAPHFATVVARGSSDNAALYGKYLLGAVNRIPVGLAAPSLFTVYQSPPDLSHALLIAISQSGQSPDLLEVAENARRQGAFTVGITNDASSPLAGLCEWVVPLHAGEERGVAATKSYTAQLMAIAMLSAFMAGDVAMATQLGALPEKVLQALGANDAARGAARKLASASRCVVIGRGYDYATADEVALKLKELTGLAADPYSAADFMHGPLAMVGADFPAILIAPENLVFPEMQRLAGTLAGMEVEMIAISDHPEKLRPAACIPLGGSIDDWLCPFVTVVPGQLLALHLALAKGLDPDRPARLSKVTRTR